MKKLVVLFSIFMLCSQCFFAVDSKHIKDSESKKDYKNKQVIIVHGFAANADKHWFKWLKNELEKNNSVNVKVLNMPNSENPNLQEWLNTLKNEVQNLDENTYFVGHSLGCITILRYLENLDSKNSKNFKGKIGGVFLVSGFYESLQILPQLDSFTKPTLDFSKVNSRVKTAFVFSARNDEIVPTTLSQNLATKLQAIFIQTPTGKHFMDREGVNTMPLLYDIIIDSINN
ncbi:serine hydrolase family protein [Helicobacter saguini]|uniref:Serine hydrolase family protein n=1 Tax=Helicobacter saguini TaxID=1548018 RepID=A0A347W3U8_9HELI|nr:alpha/beta hydrolase [Helicobacter saguini]MWV62102.1 serine hydrolase family protein [Helicobacter saguini]MWV67226.1 serine hydrolase family protein [Helicobacter saguini]MWV69579.1 serine hydrolase family protein [Helicobacter saguini]MWV70871.1 serine hydrolase family protein [Helicobacter saguini]TLD94296.1 serine hydrolase family protein [Helicobacter saguini]